ncbi:MarR family winged helix-turn-helix transcriptional regulator [Subtercola sp. Z020]|uniref:MarR family winged helix-turn-helix transcriptional regulator n=1 Tax=Subtercola sp. Z020 TaxID=2080582 RepID=UPI00130E43A7|nr:MarR family transcriptional regulator [Subtercola sp. Z020]
MTPGALPTSAMSVEATLTASRALLGVVARSVAGALAVVTLPQFRVLVVLTGSGPLRIGALAEKMAAQQSTFSRTVERMVAGGWLERSPRPGSRREVLIDITPQGRALVDEVTARRRAELGRILSHLTTEEQAAVTAALALLAQAAGETPAEDLLILGL